MDLKAFVQSFGPAPLSRLLSAVAQTGAVACSGLAGSLRAVVLARIFLSAGRTVLAVCGNAREAERLEMDLAAILGEARVFLFPEYDTVPFENRPSHGKVIEDRLRTLNGLLAGTPALVVTTFRNLLLKTVPPGYFRRNVLDIRRGDEIGMDLLVEWLARLGFERTPLVEDIGQFSVRGGIVDVFPFLTDYPVRLEFFGDTVESIRAFEIFSQRSLEKADTVRIAPLSEVVLSDEQKAACPGVRAVEWCAAGFVEDPATLFDYLSCPAVVYLDELGPPDEAHTELLGFLSAFKPAAGAARPSDNVVSPGEFQALLSKHTVVTARPFQQPGDVFFDGRPQPLFKEKGPDFFAMFRELLNGGFSVTVLCENTGQKRRFEALALEAETPVNTVLGGLDEGFVLEQDKIAVFSENRLFNRYLKRMRFRRYKGGTAVHHVSVLKKGDTVVHAEHGIGRFLGLERVKVGRSEKDCIKIEYEEKALLSVPVEDLRKVQKYSAGEDTARPPLSRLGGKAWARAKARTKKEVDRIVHELAGLYAQRKYFKGTAYATDTTWQKEFEDAFIYDDTPDQSKATGDVKTDLEKDVPMDRLLCGDAGFGKTEVAIRAVFKVVEAGKQVGVLVPTTILAYQHFHSFSERFRDYPVKVGMVSRFVQPREAAASLAALARGALDILIGTHRLLSRDVTFKDLGLLIVDEEHRFGVRHKEKLKTLKTQVDVLALTATPIPRTLQLSLIGARDLSIINTPPRNRIPIRTRVVEADRQVVREAVIRERARGGQVYFVHNRVHSIAWAAETVRAAVPQARIGIAHGQMAERELEAVMRRFIDGEIDVLVCSAIIESGLDIPNVNTIIINDADTFGLSQLYQLRGRVGRSSVQAYAVLVVRSFAGLTDDAKKRLKTLEQLTEFGSGFQVAMRDLEIRGAGNLMGVKQHGLISLVGFEMYNTLLEEALADIKAQEKIVRTEPVIRVAARAFIPHGYIEDNAQRLEFYQRLSRVDTLAHVDEIGSEMRDRYGGPPPEVGALLHIVAVRFVASRIGAAAVSIGGGCLTLEFSPEVTPGAEALGRIIRNLPKDIEIGYGTPLSIRVPLTAADGLAQARKILPGLL
jgi:transcription-repair coupling factor (superfamily II helicase)